MMYLKMRKNDWLEAIEMFDSFGWPYWGNDIKILESTDRKYHYMHDLNRLCEVVLRGMNETRTCSLFLLYDDALAFDMLVLKFGYRRGNSFGTVQESSAVKRNPTCHSCRAMGLTGKDRWCYVFDQQE